VDDGFIFVIFIIFFATLFFIPSLSLQATPSDAKATEKPDESNTAEHTESQSLPFWLDLGSK